RGVPTRVTFGVGGLGGVPGTLWSPDGEQIAFRSASGTVNVKPSSGAGNEEVLFDRPGLIHDWSSDGKFIITAERDGSIGIVPLVGDRKPFSYLSPAQFSRAQPQLSSDGRWIAYRSNESGR